MPELASRLTRASAPRSRAPSVSSPKGISDCSIELGKTMSKPTTAAPPSTRAFTILASSRVHVTVGVRLNGAVL